MKTVAGQDDFACMAETIRRRYARVLREAGRPFEKDDEADKPIVEELRTLMDRPREGPAEANPSLRALPDLILIDGGKGQLNAACAELVKLGLAQGPVIGLAKGFEESYRPGESAALRLSKESGALKMLHARPDEATRR